MSSLAKPRKVTLKGSDGLIYSFLAKPKDDLRKDARIMDLNTVVNKLLSGSSDSRRRQLRKSPPSSPLFFPSLSSQYSQTFALTLPFL